MSEPALQDTETLESSVIQEIMIDNDTDQSVSDQLSKIREDLSQIQSDIIDLRIMQSGGN